jgi:nitrilase
VSPAETLRIALAQIAPVWLDRAKTVAKVAEYISEAAGESADLVAFGEALVPGYPFWIERTDGARFDSPTQKQMFAHYLDQAVVIERGDIDALRDACRKGAINAYIGLIERPPDRGGHSVYCSMVFIDRDGEVRSVHRKTQPTYEERLVWAAGDGHGLEVHSLGRFHVGGLNCFENWMPLMRSALYAQGEDLHVACWPGGVHNTRDITRFLAIENRSYVASVSGLLRLEDIPEDIPCRAQLARESSWFANGGSAIASPDGKWLIEPVIEREALLIADLDHTRVREERHNFDLAGHYSRPDVTRLNVIRDRQTTAVFS